MSFAAERERRQTAGNRLKRLLEQQDDKEDEFYGTAYGGFVDEDEDNDYRSEESEEDVVDSDFDHEDQEQQNDDDQDQTETNKKRKNNDNNDDDDDDETKAHKRKKVIYQAQSLQQELKAQKKEETSDTKLPRQNQKKDHTSKIEIKTLRNSTSVKRVELEKRQKERQERRVHLRGVASLRNTREVRKLTQEELLEEAKITEEINLESLEAYQQIELKKKEIKRMKLIQECPRICTSSMTIHNEPKLNDNDQWNELLDESYNIESTTERCSRTFVSFTHIQTYNETFNKMNSSNRRHRRLCPITGMPAQYFDPLTQMSYATLEAFEILRRIYAEEMKKQKRTTSVLIDAQRDVNLNILR